MQIPVYVMIRPRGGDFLYSEREVEVMRRDIELLKRHKADGFVLGALTEDGRVDAELCMELLGKFSPAVLDRRIKVILQVPTWLASKPLVYKLLVLL